METVFMISANMPTLFPKTASAIHKNSDLKMRNKNKCSLLLCTVCEKDLLHTVDQCHYVLSTVSCFYKKKKNKLFLFWNTRLFELFLTTVYCCNSKHS